MIDVAIVGATGYAGQELIRILLRHPKVKIKALVSQSSANKPVEEVFPYFGKMIDMSFTNMDVLNVADAADVVFLSLPHKAAMNVAGRLLENKLRVIDLSADFRLKDKSLYPTWYGVSHIEEDLLETAVYGLPEFYRARIKKANLVANPGCYPTSALLGTLPALAEGIVDPSDIVIDAKSGASGAGRVPSDALHFPECNESIKAYKVGSHQHTPEIEQELSAVAKQDVNMVFTPHLIPMNRGILSTIYLKLNKKMTTDEAVGFYRGYYRRECFVRVLKKGEFPQTKNVTGLNYCDIGVHVDEDSGRMIVISAIDNLVKGAAGQAIQNMNIMFGFKETMGLI
ncbi:MAG TPA: N-acetyl-gamma-glutamyl-phosphate reductase [bacterium]|nr:N-acetyl-gamma-glutamyl-phosphate reductase [bacterium]